MNAGKCELSKTLSSGRNIVNSELVIVKLLQCRNSMLGNWKLPTVKVGRSASTLGTIITDRKKENSTEKKQTGNGEHVGCQTSEWEK